MPPRGRRWNLERVPTKVWKSSEEEGSIKVRNGMDLAKLALEREKERERERDILGLCHLAWLTSSEFSSVFACVLPPVSSSVREMKISGAECSVCIETFCFFFCSSLEMDLGRSFKKANLMSPYCIFHFIVLILFTIS